MSDKNIKNDENDEKIVEKVEKIEKIGKKVEKIEKIGKKIDNDDDEKSDNDVNDEEKLDISSAIVLGSTGETGRLLINELTRYENIEKVGCVVRKKKNERKLDELLNRFELGKDAIEKLGDDADKVKNIKERSKKIIIIPVDFDKIDDYKDEFKGYDAGFSCLGSTRSKAGSAEAFRKIDYDYVYNSVKIMKDNGVKHFTLMSSEGANPKSWFLYPKVKGQLEDAIGKLKFDKFSVFRPGLLITKRGEKRGFEGVLQKALPKIEKILPWSAQSIKTSLVAKHMAYNVFKQKQKFAIFNNKAILTNKFK